MGQHGKEGRKKGNTQNLVVYDMYGIVKSSQNWTLIDLLIVFCFFLVMLSYSKRFIHIFKTEIGTNIQKYIYIVHAIKVNIYME